MLHGYGLNVSTVPLYDHRIWGGKKFSGELPTKESSSNGSSIKCSLPTDSIGIQGCIERIRERLNVNGLVEVSPSSYDTAWVAMVPSREYSGSSSKPCFPQCLDWIMENQNPDGSWGMKHPSLVKDSLSCTLASLLALRKWNVGEQLVRKGLDYIGSNDWAICDNNQISPIGYDTIFPRMIDSARGMGLILPNSKKMDYMINKIKSTGPVNHVNLGYVAEGLGKSCDWKYLFTQQRSNGSLFNSPATTAASLIQYHNEKCFHYLLAVLETYQKWVPTIQPTKLYTRLRIVDTLEKLGIHRYFEHEIKIVLDETYRCWLQKDEEIFSDLMCCALAFRLLRMKGYEVSSDELEAFSEKESFFNMTSIQFTGVPTILELYRASQLTIYEGEHILEKIQAWTSNFLKQQLLNHTILDKKLHKQVKYAMKSFYCTLDRVENRRSIEIYDIGSYRMLKTAYRCPTIDHEDFLRLAQEDFLICQTQHQKEFQELKMWYKNSGLDLLKFGRNVSESAYFLVASVLVDPKLSEARMVYAQALVLATLLDDFFDNNHGSRTDLVNFIKLVNKWDQQPIIDNCSEEIQILFTAIYNNVNELGEKAVVRHGRCIKKYIFSVWIDILKSNLKEVDWSSENIVPTMEEYLSNACISIAVNICALTPLHFLGPKLSEEMVTSTECNTMCHLTSLISRLLNDLRTFKKEQAERTENVLSLLLVKGEGGIEEEESIAKIKGMIESSRRKLLRMVLQTKGSLLPQVCKDHFWNICKFACYLYQKSDEFTSPQEMKTDINAVLFQPLKSVPETC